MRYPAFIAALGLLGGCASHTTQPSRPMVERTAGAVERPGIGTGSGEWRNSPVSVASFSRAWGDRPSATDRQFYNDRDGVDAMLEYLGGEPRQASGLQKAAGGLVRFGLRDGAGHWLDTWDLRGRRIAVGESGARYEVVVRNETRRRIEVVISVDGLDVIDGKQAAFSKRGYVLLPGETAAIEGFRAGTDGVAAFRFVSVGDTYAKRRFSETRNVGVLGLAVFTERWSGSPATPTAGQRAWRIGGSPSGALPDA